MKPENVFGPYSVIPEGILGKGAYGTVWKAKGPDGVVAALDGADADMWALHRLGDHKQQSSPVPLSLGDILERGFLEAAKRHPSSFRRRPPPVAAEGGTVSS